MLDELDTLLIDRRANGRYKANQLEALWKDSECQHRQRRRAQNRALWFELFFCGEVEHLERLGTLRAERNTELTQIVAETTMAGAFSPGPLPI